jgi:hypothetical protein
VTARLQLGGPPGNRQLGLELELFLALAHNAASPAEYFRLPETRTVYGRVGGPVGEGAAVVAHLASPGSQVDSGSYYRGFSRGQPAPIVADRKSVGRLWKLSARLTGLD